MGYWVLKCTECRNSWKLLVSFPLKQEYSKLYHFCPHCNRNTFHEVIEYREEEPKEI